MPRTFILELFTLIVLRVVIVIIAIVTIVMGKAFVVDVNLKAHQLVDLAAGFFKDGFLFLFIVSTTVVAVQKACVNMLDPKVTLSPVLTP